MSCRLTVNRWATLRMCQSHLVDNNSDTGVNMWTTGTRTLCQSHPVRVSLMDGRISRIRARLAPNGINMGLCNVSFQYILDQIKLEMFKF